MSETISLTPEDGTEGAPAQRAEPTPELVIGGQIGQGGTAQVFSAQQTALGREVAVKVPGSPQHAAGMLREARVLGRLEHPNIPPVHDIRRGPDGMPWIVMRRVRGGTWLERMTDPLAAMGLEENIAVLLQVAQAVAFAHAHGVIHRDLKPENVMIGPFGEVLLLDWGLAVAAEGGPERDLDGFADLPAAATQTRAAGTPCCMPPEAVGDPELLRAQGIALPDLSHPGPITVRSDVFLLGAILYRVLAGHAPYSRSEQRDELTAAWICDPPPPPGPPDLVAVALRAMRRDPAGRYATAADFRDALEDWSTARLVDAAIRRREPEEAASRLARLHRADPALGQRIQQLRRDLAAERELRLRADPRTHAGVRRAVIAAASLIFAVSPVLLSRAEAAGRPLYPLMIGFGDGLLLLLGAAAFLLRGRLLQSDVNRDALILFAVALLAQSALDAALWWLGEPPRLAMTLHLLVLAAISAAAIPAVHRRMGAAVAIFLAAFAVSVLSPPLVWTVSAMTGFLFVLGVIRSSVLDWAGGTISAPPPSR